MSLIADILPPELVFGGVEVTSKKRALEIAAQAFEERAGLVAATIFDSLFAREKLGSTGLGEGIAIPHGRIKGLKAATGAFLRLASPIAFDAPDGQPVDLMFVLLVPEKASDLHLQILGELAQLLSEPEVRSRLRGAPSPAELHGILTG